MKNNLKFKLGDKALYEGKIVTIETIDYEAREGMPYRIEKESGAKYWVKQSELSEINNMKELEKFNAETTPLGTELITRDGREVTEWYYFKTNTDEYSVVAIIDACRLGHTINGDYGNGSTHPYDLFIKPKVKECWVNVFVNKNGILSTSSYYSSKEMAMMARIKEIDYIKTIRITDEPE